jgi:isoquinoline 1-oxidoreductase beta subunit
VTTIDRRSLIQSMAATAGAAVSSGAWALRLPGAEAEADLSDSGPTETGPGRFGAYLAIATDGVTTIVVPSAELGQGVYTTLPMLVAEELDADWSRTEPRLAWADPAFGNPARRGVQVTGGSDSIPGYHVLLRRLGASARASLVQVAATDWRVPPAECRTSYGEVFHVASGRRVGYGALAVRAARLEPDQSPALKAPSEFTLLGRSPGRKDTPAKCDGSARFGADLRLPGMLFGAVSLAPVPGSRLAGFDRAAALSGRGVHALVEVEGGLGAVAESTWAAERALREAAPRFEPPSGASESSADVAAALRAALGEPGRVSADMADDVEPALRDAVRSLDAVYEVPLLAHACMEPMSATAWITESGECRVWAPSQRQGAAREAAAHASGLPLERVTLQGTFCGGGFGRRWEVDFVRHAVQLAAAVRGRPVAMTWSREADLRGDFFRAPYACRIRGALDAQGRIMALQATVAGPSLLAFQGRPATGPDPSAIGNLILPQYAVARRRVEFVERAVAQRIGFWRAVSLSQNGFFGECAIDELARLAGLDGLAFRHSLLQADARGLAVLERAARESGWYAPRPRGVGLGIAFSSGFGSYHAQVARVRVEDRAVTVERVTCVHDCGFAFDPDTVAAQMEGGVLFGLSALVQSVEVVDGAPQPANLDAFPMLRFAQSPRIDVHLVDSGAAPGGVGEASTAATLPAVANAIFDATGRRIRRLPIALEGFELA